MRMYSVLLVDDEEEVYEAIIKKLDWKELGFEVAGYARNGQEALEMAEELKPDVVMTDIKMPYMDGFELARRVKEMYKNTRFIIFSGFDELEYAKETIKIKAEEYILKPINSSELREVFERLKKNLDDEMAEKSNLEKLRERYLKSLPAMQVQFLGTLMEGNLSETQIEEYLDNCQLNLSADNYAVSIIRIDSVPTGNKMLYLAPLKGIVEEFLTEEFINTDYTENKWKFRCFQYVGNLVVLSMFENGMSISRYTDTLDRMCRNAERFLNISVTAGIGPVCNRLSQMEISYQGALEALSYKVMFNDTNVISITDLEPDPYDTEYLNDVSIEDVIRGIKLLPEEEINGIVDEFVENIRQAKLSVAKYRVVIMELITELMKLVNAYKLDMSVIFAGDKDIYARAMELESSESMKEWLYNVCIAMKNSIRKERTDSAKLIVERAMQYVKENYGDIELSVDVLCGILNVSAAYFSTIFKKQTGQSFVNYLTQVRMEHAVELLNTTDDKTYVIAEKVGYLEPNYFSYVFRKHFGISPSKYRTSKVGNNEEQG
ncbi:MAG: response regulator [Thermoflexaceae bacterium]|nr:response regulator [Thermoflexaceae bacterium]